MRRPLIDVARDVLDNSVTLSPKGLSFRYDRMVAALRKAKADGMRQTAKYAPNAETYNQIMQMADAEENGR